MCVYSYMATLQCMCVYSQDWVCRSVVASVCDVVRAVTGGPGQLGERRTTSAAGSQSPAWSSAGPVRTNTQYITYISKKV